MGQVTGCMGLSQEGKHPDATPTPDVLASTEWWAPGTHPTALGTSGVLLLTGTSVATIDAKQRLAVPAKMRAQYTPADGEKPVWVSVPWPDGPLIRLYPLPVFASLAASQGGTLTPDEDTAALETTLFSLAERLDMDTAGRVRLPKRHLELSSLGSDVMVAGANNRLEIWTREQWEAEELKRFQQLPSIIRRKQA
ncbi:MAG: hypothetical protein AAF235_08085 [Planctomycetota bacterium]